MSRFLTPASDVLTQEVASTLVWEPILIDAPGRKRQPPAEKPGDASTAAPASVAEGRSLVILPRPASRLTVTESEFELNPTATDFWPRPSLPEPAETPVLQRVDIEDPPLRRLKSTDELPPYDPDVERRHLSQQRLRHGPAWDLSAAAQPAGAEFVAPWTRRAFAAALIFSAVGAVATVIWQGTLFSRPEKAASPPASAAPKPSPAAVRERIAGASRAALAASSASELLPWVRRPDSVRTQIEAAFFVKGANPLAPDGGALPAFAAAPIDHLGGDFWTYRTGSSERQTPRQIWEMSAAGPRLDWEASLGVGELSWEDLVKTKPTQPVLMRVVATEDDYFNRAFANPREFACYRLADLRGEHFVYGYARRLGSAYASLRQVAITRSAAAVTVRVRYPAKDAAPDQVEIAEFVSDTWLVQE